MYRGGNKECETWLRRRKAIKPREMNRGPRSEKLLRKNKKHHAVFCATQGSTKSTTLISGRKQTPKTYRAYGAGQAGGHLPMLVAVHRRVTTTAAAGLGSSSGRGRRRGVTLQLVRKHLL